MPVQTRSMTKRIRMEQQQEQQRQQEQQSIIDEFDELVQKYNKFKQIEINGSQITIPLTFEKNAKPEIDKTSPNLVADKNNLCHSAGRILDFLDKIIKMRRKLNFNIGDLIVETVILIYKYIEYILAIIQAINGSCCSDKLSNELFKTSLMRIQELKYQMKESYYTNNQREKLAKELDEFRIYAMEYI